MKILLQHVRIKDKSSSNYDKTVHILIENGLIKKISKQAEAFDDKKTKVYDLKGCDVYPGFSDGRVHSGAPGHEQKEDFESLTSACINGGILNVGILPDTEPTIETSEAVRALKSGFNTKDGLSMNIYPIGALTKDFDGINFCDLTDLHHAGVSGFTDVNPIDRTKTIELALNYLKSFNGVLIDLPLDTDLILGKMVNESPNTTKIGLPGIPNYAETNRIQRGLSVLEYTGGRLHFSLVNTREGVELIKKAKKAGLNVTCDTAVHYLHFDDSVLDSFDPNYKVYPPLRNKQDVKALNKAVETGIIDMVVSDHTPQNKEIKDLEFDRSEYGISGVETLVPGLIELGHDLYKVLVEGPARVLGMDGKSIEEGTEAEITIVNPKGSTEITASWMKSKSKNSPWLNNKLKGQVVGIIKGKTHTL